MFRLSAHEDRPVRAGGPLRRMGRWLAGLALGLLLLVVAAGLAGLWPQAGQPVAALALPGVSTAEVLYDVTRGDDPARIVALPRRNVAVLMSNDPWLPLRLLRQGALPIGVSKDRAICRVLTGY